eukprot:4463495-Pyramimonas_sp.AAC.1
MPVRSVHSNGGTNIASSLYSTLVGDPVPLANCWLSAKSGRLRPVRKWRWTKALFRSCNQHWMRISHVMLYPPW